VRFTTLDGAEDGVSVQPYATVSLPGNSDAIHPVTRERYAQLQVVDTRAKSGPVIEVEDEAPAVVDVPVVDDVIELDEAEPTIKQSTDQEEAE
jgi:hypothetical protein